MASETYTHDPLDNPDRGLTMARDRDVIGAWADVMADVQAVSKGDRNQQQGFSFRGIDAVMNAVGPALRKHGVVIVPTVEEANYREVEVGKNRTLQRECTVKVRYTVYGPSGGWFSGTVFGEALDSGDKATAKAHSVAYRTFLLQALTIPTHDPDPDSTSVERAARHQYGKADAKVELVRLLGSAEAAKEVWEWGSADDLTDLSPAAMADLAKRWNERPMEVDS